MTWVRREGVWYVPRVLLSGHGERIHLVGEQPLGVDVTLCGMKPPWWNTCPAPKNIPVPKCKRCFRPRAPSTGDET